MEKLFSNKAQIPAAAYRLKVTRLGLLPAYALILVILHFGFHSSLVVLVAGVLLFSAVNYVLILFYLRIMRPFRAGVKEAPQVVVESEQPVVETKAAEPLTGYNPLTFVSFGLTAVELIMLFAIHSAIGFLFGVGAAAFGHVASSQIRKENQNGFQLNRVAIIFAYVGMVAAVVGFFVLVQLFIENYHGGVPVS